MHTECRICGSEDKRILIKIKFAEVENISFLNGYDVCVCNSCGFGFASNIPSQDEFNTYYKMQSKYENDYSPNGRDYSPIIKLLTKYAKNKHSRILEIGTGDGGLLNALSQESYDNLFGIDPSAKCVDRLRKIPNCRGEMAALNDLDESYSSDIVILASVLEHICDIKNSTAKLSNLMVPNGYLLLETPDVSSFNLDFQPPFQEFSIEHINYFSRVSLANLMSKYGLRLIEYVPYVSGGMICLFQKGANLGEVFDTSTYIALESYIQKSKCFDEKIINIITPYYNRKVIIWGAGTYTRHLWETLKKCDVVCVVDSNPHYQGGSFAIDSRSVEIIPPQYINADKSIPIIVVSRNYQDEIVNEIMNIHKLRNPIITLF